MCVCVCLPPALEQGVSVWVSGCILGGWMCVCLCVYVREGLTMRRQTTRRREEEKMRENPPPALLLLFLLGLMRHCIFLPVPYTSVCVCVICGWVGLCVCACVQKTKASGHHQEFFHQRGKLSKLRIRPLVPDRLMNAERPGPFQPPQIVSFRALRIECPSCRFPKGTFHISKVKPPLLA